MKINKKIIEELTGYLKEFNLSEIEYAEGSTKVKVSRSTNTSTVVASEIKKKGPIWLGLTEKVVSLRSYEKLSQIWKMVSRTAFEQLHNSIVILFLCILGLIIIYLIPLINFLMFLFLGNHFLSIVNLISILLMITSLVPTINFYKISNWFYLSLPISSLLYICMTISSAYNYFFRKGNTWKGRKY